MKWILLLQLMNPDTAAHIPSDAYDSHDFGSFDRLIDCEDSGSNQAVFIERLYEYTIYVRFECRMDEKETREVE